MLDPDCKDEIRKLEFVYSSVGHPVDNVALQIRNSDIVRKVDASLQVNSNKGTRRPKKAIYVQIAEQHGMKGDTVKSIYLKAKRLPNTQPTVSTQPANCNALIARVRRGR